MTSFPGCSSIPLICCPFRSPSPCFYHLQRAGRPVRRGFRSPDQRLALQQPRCAIRGNINQKPEYNRNGYPGLLWLVMATWTKRSGGDPALVSACHARRLGDHRTPVGSVNL